MKALTTRRATNNHQLLVRELFQDAHACILDDIEKVKLPKDHINVLYDRDISTTR